MFGEFFFAKQAIQQSLRLVLSVPRTDVDVFFAPNAVFGAVFILAAKLIEIVHDRLLDIQVSSAQLLADRKRIIENPTSLVNTHRSQGAFAVVRERDDRIDAQMRAARSRHFVETSFCFPLSSMNLAVHVSE